MRDTPKFNRPKFYRQKSVWSSLLISVLLHLAVAYLARDFWMEEIAPEAFRARLARIPRFKPKRLVVIGNKAEMPRVEMEYLSSQAEPQQMPEGDLAALPPAVSEVEVSGAPLALREVASGAKEDEPQFERVKMIRPSELGLADSLGIRSMDLLRIVDMARAGKEHAMVIEDRGSRRDLMGYVNFTRLRVYGAGSDTGGSLDAMTRYLRDNTKLLATVREGEPYDYFLSEHLLKDPLHFLFQGGGLQAYRDEVLTYFSEEEKELLGQYLHGGGFLFVEGNNRFLREMAGQFKSVLGDEGALVVIPGSHPLYHSFYDFGGGFPGESKSAVAESADQNWYYPVRNREVAVDPLVNPQFTLEEEEEERLPPLGLWGVELNGELVVAFSDLELHDQWIGSFNAVANDDRTSLPALMAGTNVVVYALIRAGGLTPKEKPPVWMARRPEIPVLIAQDGGEPEILAGQQELLGDLDASLAVVQAPLGSEIGKGGLAVRLNGSYGLELLKKDAHGLLLHNLPAGQYWLELEYGGKRKQLEIELQGGKVLTVTFGLNRFAFLRQLYMSQQERQVKVDQWLENFSDLRVEELYLDEDRGLLEEAQGF